jgi:ABC-type Fe3+/spermidine/putrescine transport system ATPase subunit
MDSRPPVIQVQGGGKRYGGARGGRPWVFRQLSLDIRAGEFFTVVGPSGCGKSTLLRTIAGLETLTEGAILIDGVPSSAAGIHVPPERRDIAMVFQSYAIWPHMSVAENAGFALRYGRRACPVRR